LSDARVKREFAGSVHAVPKGGRLAQRATIDTRIGFSQVLIESTARAP
jgi:hypothetical protein